MVQDIENLVKQLSRAGSNCLVESQLNHLTCDFLLLMNMASNQKIVLISAIGVVLSATVGLVWVQPALPTLLYGACAGALSLGIFMVRYLDNKQGGLDETPSEPPITQVPSHVAPSRKSEPKVGAPYLPSRSNKAQKALNPSCARLLPPLTKEQLERANKLKKTPIHEQVCTQSHGVHLLGKDLQTLNDGSWLNDEIINSYANLLNERSASSPELPSCHVFNSFFYSHLSKGGYKKVEKWTVSKDEAQLALPRQQNLSLFNHELIIMPIHYSANHWTVAAINFKEKRFEYYDSLGGKGVKVLKHLRDYLIEEAKAKNETIDINQWSNYTPGANIPQQHNGNDCGVFTLLFANALSQGSSFNFSQKDIPHARSLIATQLDEGRLDVSSSSPLKMRHQK